MNDDKREKFLRTLADKLTLGVSVSRNELVRALTADELRKYDEDWLQEKSSRNVAIPPTIVTYQKYFKAGTLLHNRKEAMYRGGVATSKILQMSQKAEAKLEWALIVAQECVCRDESMMMWFDRDPRLASFSSPLEMPHISSTDSRRYAFGLGPRLRIRDCKEIAINLALENLQVPTDIFDLLKEEQWVPHKVVCSRIGIAALGAFRWGI
jgi:hypothetical protein